uniref:Cytochrome c oxidase subunit 3 n=1 Tax=Mesocestoides corti TaxID=53468 RepID=A0A1E1GI38_MESCO|nr:cytochrome c oxidase subunit III [Mesocestoides corti]
MSIFPVFVAFYIGFLLVGLFFWNMLFLFVGCVGLLFSLLLYWWDLKFVCFHYESAFWLFIFSEVSVFGCLLVCCLYYDSFGFISLSSPLELPFLGCFVLLGSSITVTAYHHLLFWDGSRYLLFYTVLLGLGFVVLQLLEFDEVFINLLGSSFYGSSFCTVGLHFIHVLLGVVALFFIFVVGSMEAGMYRCTVATWYWHFVDYVWLFVYTVVYVC